MQPCRFRHYACNATCASEWAIIAQTDKRTVLNCCEWTLRNKHTYRVAIKPQKICKALKSCSEKRLGMFVKVMIILQTLQFWRLRRECVVDLGGGKFARNAYLPCLPYFPLQLQRVYTPIWNYLWLFWDFSGLWC